MKYLLTALVLIFASFNSSAEQKFVKDNWDVHYIAFPSGFLEPEVARQYGLIRSKYKAVVNISVLDNQNKMKAQNLAVSGSAKNLLGQTKNLTFTKVEEGEAIYYLAQFDYRNEEIVNITVNLQQGNRNEKIEFKKKLYVD